MKKIAWIIGLVALTGCYEDQDRDVESIDLAIVTAVVGSLENCPEQWNVDDDGTYLWKDDIHLFVYEGWYTSLYVGAPISEDEVNLSKTGTDALIKASEPLRLKAHDTGDDAVLKRKADALSDLLECSGEVIVLPDSGYITTRVYYDGEVQSGGGKSCECEE